MSFSSIKVYFFTGLTIVGPSKLSFSSIKVYFFTGLTIVGPSKLSFSSIKVYFFHRFDDCRTIKAVL